MLYFSYNTYSTYNTYNSYYPLSIKKATPSEAAFILQRAELFHHAGYNLLGYGAIVTLHLLIGGHGGCAALATLHN